MNNLLNNKVIGGIVVVVALSSIAYQSFAQTTDNWLYFPSNENGNRDLLHLALTAAKGNSVSMSYTPATYLVKTDTGKKYIDLQIENAPLLPGDDVISVSGIGMDIIFDPDGSQAGWVVNCYNETLIKENKLVGEKLTNTRLHISDNQCNFNSGWSDTLRIYPGDGHNSITIKTVWDKDRKGNGDPENEYGINGLGLINVFKFRTQNGTVSLLNTDTTKIRKQNNELIGNQFRKISNKSAYENSLNWAVIYNTGQTAKFEFLVDVKGKDELILFEKDADAAGLFPDSVPPDTGVKLLVQWEDGSFVEPWTNLDQTVRANLPRAMTGEKNSYIGPSGDTITDPGGVNSIKWYSIDVSRQKSERVKIVWEGFGVPSNAIGLAADGVVGGGGEGSEGSYGSEDDDGPDEADEAMEADEANQAIRISRCYAYDYFGGEFECNNSCSTIEPGTKVTVRDTLTNKGGARVYNHTYFPEPLASSFEYEGFSIRVDQPETGIAVANDGVSFPPVGGVTVPGPIEGKKSRWVFFSYYVPDGVLNEPVSEVEMSDGRCYGGGNIGTIETIGTIGTIGKGEIEYENDCGDDDSGTTNKGKICVRVEENPKLLVEFEAVPTTKTTLYQGSMVTYLVRIWNTTRQPVVNLIVDGIIPEESDCKSGNCKGLNVSNPTELKEKGVYEYLYSVKIKDLAEGVSIFHPGHRITFMGEAGQVFEIKTNSLEHKFIPTPGHVGDFRHDMEVSRRIVLNAKDREARGDKGDLSKVTHEFSYSGTGRFVQPYLSDGSVQSSYSRNFCNEAGYSGPGSTYDAPFYSQMYAYNSSATIRSQPLSSSSSIRNDDLLFTISTKLPKDRPEFLNLSGRGSEYEDLISYGVSAGKILTSGINAVNYFMANGGEIEKAKLISDEKILSAENMPVTEFRAVADGQGGMIKAYNTVSAGAGILREDLWIYTRVGNRPPISCSKRCGKSTCVKKVTPPEYKWILSDWREVLLEASDVDYITALASVAWLQTKFGHLGFGKSFWTETPGDGDPNLVKLSDRSLATEMKFYTPQSEYNADLLVYSPDGRDPLRSKMNEKIVSSGFEQGFIADEPRLSRGEAYDRKNFPRDYYDDLLNKQIFGKVIRLNSNSKLPAGMTKTGDMLFLNGTVVFAADTVYHFKGDAVIGFESGPVTIAGGRARLFIDGDVRIYGNVFYSQKSGAKLSEIPALRLHSRRNIYINQKVTDIELMMLSENEFHSGKGDQQLRILGDVIAYKVYWERAPLNQEREMEEMVNKPSEIIYEDFRKYILTPPGDRKLPDVGWGWGEYF